MSSVFRGSPRQRGFTLVELSIVLVIISLIIAGIISKASMIRVSEVNSVITEVEGFKTAIGLFRDKYRSWPGDIPDATNYWSGTANGDGDRMIESATNEELRAWQHLSLSKSIAGSYSGTGNYTRETNLPISQLKAGTYLLIYNSSAIYGKQGNHFRLGAISGNTALDRSAISPQRAIMLDKKIDDGEALTGNLVATDGSDATAGDCINTTPTPDVYNLRNAEKSCVITFWID